MPGTKILALPGGDNWDVGDLQVDGAGAFGPHGGWLAWFALWPGSSSGCPLTRWGSVSILAGMTANDKLGFLAWHEDYSTAWI